MRHNATLPQYFTGEPSCASNPQLAANYLWFPYLKGTQSGCPAPYSPSYRTHHVYL